MDNKKQLTIDISFKAILKIVLVILILAFLYLIRSAVTIFIISVIFSSIMIPAVDYLKKRKIPRTLSVTVIYLIIFCLIALAIYLIIPIVSTQVSGLAANLSEFFNKFFNSWGNRLGFQNKDLFVYIQKALESFSNQFSSLTQNIYNLTVKVIGGVATVIIILVLSFYLTIEKNASKKLIHLFTPKNKEQKLVNLIHKAQRKMGLWVGGQLIMSFLVFIISFIVFFILRLPNAFTLALIMGILEIIPYFGPLIGGTAAALVAFSQSFWLGIIIIIAVILIQQAENHIFMPNVMKKVTGLSPVIVILAILIGLELFGLLGIIIAVPVATGLAVILPEIISTDNHGISYKSNKT